MKVDGLPRHQVVKYTHRLQDYSREFNRKSITIPSKRGKYSPTIPHPQQPIRLTLKDAAFYTAAVEVESVDVVLPGTEPRRSICNARDLTQRGNKTYELHNELRRQWDLKPVSRLLPDMQEGS